MSPPWVELLRHAPHFGLGAVAGAAIGAFLAWPQTVYTNPSTGHAVEYQNRLGLTSFDTNGAWWTFFFALVFFGIIGAFVGAILVSMGVLRKEDLKID